MKFYIPFALLLLLAQGCATQNKSPLQVIEDEPERVEQMRAVHTDLIREMIRQENYHAALAHIEELQRAQQADQLLLLHAEVLFKLGRIQEAHADYVKLMGGPYDAEAMHGIGLMHAINDPRLSLDYLGKAARGKPTDAGMRNDFGYALLRIGEYTQARLHLTTAHELAPGDTRYRNNALLIMLIEKDEGSASRLIEKTGMSQELVTRIRQQAHEWQIKTDGPANQPRRPAVTQAKADQAA